MASDTKQVIFFSQIDKAIDWVDRCCTKIINNGLPAYLSVSDMPPEEARDKRDNDKFHAIMHDIWKQAIIMQGRSFEACKASLVLAFCRELEEMGEELPKYMRIERTICPFTKELVSIRPSTTKFSKKWAQQFCQWLWATGSEIGVKWSDPASKEYEQMMSKSEV